MWEGYKLLPLTFVKLVLELHPVEAKCVQETLKHIHHHQDCERCWTKQDECDPKLFEIKHIYLLTMMARPKTFSHSIATTIVFSKNTDASCEWARDKAHRRR